MNDGKQLIANYKTIAITNIISKFVEKCIKCRLVNFLENKKLLILFNMDFRE